MKKLLALVLMTVMAVALFAGCSDPVYNDLKKFLNTDMADVNLNYEAIVSEMTVLDRITDDTILENRLRDSLIPLVDSTITMLDGIAPSTAQVKVLKNKYVAAMKAYKDGFEKLAEGCATQDNAIIEAADQKLVEARALFEIYSDGLKALAEKVGMKIELE